MHPFTRPPLPDGTPETYGAFARALGNTAGRFCAFCEKALTYRITLFHRTRGALPPTFSVGRNDWESLFPVCGDCTAAMDTFTPGGNYFWPDSAAARSVVPYRYDRVDQVTCRVLTAHGTTQVDEACSLVLVSVATDVPRDVADAARNTLALFRLNGRWLTWNAERPVLELPHAEYLRPTDYRLEQRWDAYTRGAEAGAMLARALSTTLAGRQFVRTTMANAQQIVRAFGYASSWSAGVRDELNRAGPDLLLLLLRILNPPERQPSDTSSRTRLYSQMLDTAEQVQQDEMQKRRRLDDLVDRMIDVQG